MTPSQLMQAMADAGAPMEAIVIALRALEEKDAEIAARDAVVAEKRAKDAERKRLARVHGHSTDIPETIRGASEDPSLSLPPNENNSNPPTHTHPDGTTRARKAGVFPMLDCTDQETWADFLTNRSKKRLPNTASAHRKLETDLAAMVARTGWPPGRVFAACVAKGWGAIYDPRDEENGRSNITPIRKTGGPGPDHRSSLTRAIDEGLEWLG